MAAATSSGTGVYRTRCGVDAPSTGSSERLRSRLGCARAQRELGPALGVMECRPARVTVCGGWLTVFEAAAISR